MYQGTQVFCIFVRSWIVTCTMKSNSNVQDHILNFKMNQACTETSFNQLCLIDEVAVIHEQEKHRYKYYLIPIPYV